MKSRSLLISYSGYPTSPHAFMPDNGLAVLAGSLIAAGHQTAVLDYSTLDIMRLVPGEYGKRILSLRADRGANSDGELRGIAATLEQIQERDIRETAASIAATVKEQKIDFLAFKLWTGTAFANSVRLAEEIKRFNPSVPIYAGGPHVDYFRGRVYKATGAFDALAYGEGEETIVELAECALGERPIESVHNLVLKSGDRIFETPEKRLTDLNRSFPLYDPEVYPALKGDKKLKLFLSEFSRGCPFHCNFCGHSNKSGSLWRSKSAQNITAEFRSVIRDHGTRIFRNGDSNTPGALIKDVAERILLEGLDVEYALISHVNNLDPDSFGLLKDSGCFSIFFGIESGNQEVLDRYINKGLKLDRVKKIIEKCKDNGLFVVTSFISPSPGDTDESRKETFEFIKRSRIDTVNVCTPVITPRSVWGDNPERFGIELGENYFDELMYFTPALFYPPTMWKPLNYRINGKDFFRIAEESDAFAASLEKEGALTQVMDDVALMARHCGMGFREFRDNVRGYLTGGDQESMGEIIKEINRSARFTAKSHI